MELILAGKFNSLIASKNFEEMLNEKNIPFIRKAEDMGLALHPSLTGGVKIYISKEDYEKFTLLCNEISATPQDFLGPDIPEEMTSEEMMRAHRISRILTWIAVFSFFGIIITNMISLPDKVRVIASILCGLGMVVFEFAAHIVRGKENY